MPALLAGPLAILALVLMLLTLPVTLPLALAWGGWKRRRQRSIIDRTCCIRCGHILGQAALQAADADHVAELGAMQQRFPNGLVNLLRRADARCTACGATYAWDRRRHRLRPLEDATSPGP